MYRVHCYRAGKQQSSDLNPDIVAPEPVLSAPALRSHNRECFLLWSQGASESLE